ncbi:MAG: hypothetical protein WBA35_04895, partial [Litorimonas sp.]
RRETVKTVLDGVQDIRVRALAEHRTYEIRPDGSPSPDRAVTAAVLSVPEGWAVGGAVIRIDTSGLCSGGQLVLEDPNGRRTVSELEPPYCHAPS